MPNHLVNQNSPYLLQHAHNPVDWFPWSEEALAKSRAEDKPIFLSIGYAACHWCHVMAHESFEDEQTAAYMNEHFINIKVDREERLGVLACSALKERYRQQLMDGNDGVGLVYLKGSYELIWSRMEARTDHYMKPHMLQSQFEALEEPTNALIVDISLSVHEIIQVIMQQME